MNAINVNGNPATPKQLNELYLKSLGASELLSEYDSLWDFVPRGCRNEDGDKYELREPEEYADQVQAEIARRGGMDKLYMEAA